MVQIDDQSFDRPVESSFSQRPCQDIQFTVKRIILRGGDQVYLASVLLYHLYVVYPYLGAFIGAYY